jgi:hypothetical protein
MEKSKTFSTDAVIINASKEKVWDLLFHRFSETHLFNPNIEGSHDINSKKGEVGCERQCNIDKKTFIKERVVKADEFRSFTIDVIGGNMPMLKEMQIVFAIESISPNQTRVMINAEFNTKPSFLAGLIKGMFKKMLFGVLVGLKYHLETGQLVSKNTFKPIFKKYQNLQVSQSF